MTSEQHLQQFAAQLLIQLTQSNAKIDSLSEEIARLRAELEIGKEGNSHIKGIKES